MHGIEYEFGVCSKVVNLNSRLLPLSEQSGDLRDWP